MKKGTPPLVKSLIRNTESALLSSIEIHNKPVFSYRYEVSVILLINAWELALKAYIYKFLKNKVKLIFEDGTTKPFLECLGCVKSNLKKEFFMETESIEALFDYRNNIIHFYGQKMDSVVFSLLQKNILLLSNFIKKYFKVDLSKKTDLILLPLGFKKVISPVDFLSNDSYTQNSSQEVKDFLNKIIERVDRLKKAGIEDSILVTYRMNIENVNRVKNADIIAAIDNQNEQKNKIQINKFQFSNDPNARKLKIDSDDEIFKTIFTESRSMTSKYMRENFICKIDKKYYKIRKEFEDDPNLFRFRLSYPSQPEKGGMPFFSKQIYKAFEKFYKRKNNK